VHGIDVIEKRSDKRRWERLQFSSHELNRMINRYLGRFPLQAEKLENRMTFRVVLGFGGHKRQADVVQKHAKVVPKRKAEVKPESETQVLGPKEEDTRSEFLEKRKKATGVADSNNPGEIPMGNEAVEQHSENQEKLFYPEHGGADLETRNGVEDMRKHEQKPRRCSLEGQNACDEVKDETRRIIEERVAVYPEESSPPHVEGEGPGDDTKTNGDNG
jgi:hypothetical protein